MDKMNIKEFRESGYLQEVNRLFLHPLGLALEIIIEEDGTEKLGGVWDYREDDEGMRYHESVINSPQFHNKKENIAKIIRERREKREQLLGYWTQSNDTTV